MLTFDGSWFFLVIHAALWFGSFGIALGQQDKIFGAVHLGPAGAGKWNDDRPERGVYMMYWLFTLLAPILLVVYESLCATMDEYGPLRVPIQGFIFAAGILGVAFGTASIPYAVAANVLAEHTTGLGLAASGLGMFITFHSEFRTTQRKAVKANAVFPQTPGEWKNAGMHGSSQPEL